MKRILYIGLLAQFLSAQGQIDFLDVTDELDIGAFESAPTYGSGVCAIDADNDGDIDLYILSNGDSRNQYFRNEGNGEFTNVSNGLDVEMRSRAALWFDFDGDHLLDVLIAGDCSFSGPSCLDRDNLRLFRQTETGTFVDHTSASGLLTGRSISGVLGGLAAGDYNNDGFLDLVITLWGGDVTLWKNEGNGTFEDVTESARLDDASKYWQPLFYDLDQDGWTDLYLTVDNQPNLFYLNNSDGTFSEIGIPLNLDNDHNDMGVALGDFDADQDFDVYVTNIERDSEGDHNILLKNELQTGTLDFNEVSISLGVDSGGWGWGCTFLDGDNDGFLDLAATNGWVTDFTDPSKFWRNTGSVFEDLSEQVGFNDVLQATSLVSFDMDRDGDLDLAQTLKENPDQTIAFRLLENQLNTSAEMGNYLVVKPRMSGSNRLAIGSTIRITTSNSIQSRPITSGISFYGQEPAEAHFGLGDLTEAEKVEVIWPGGAVSSVLNVTVNQVITINDGDVLHAPGALEAKALSSSEVALTWGHMSTSETGYIIDRSTTNTFDEMVQFNTSELTFHDEGLDPFTTYYYRVKAENSSLESGFSNVTSARTDSDVVILSPKSLVASPASLTSVELYWEDVAENEEGYTLQRSLFEDFDSFISVDLSPDENSFTDENVEPHTIYYYRIQAYRVDGISDFSNTAMVETIVLGNSAFKSESLIYPNPAQEFFRLDIQPGLNPTKVLLTNIFGQVLSEWYFGDSSEIEHHQFATPRKEGLYFVQVEEEGTIAHFKLMVIQEE